MALAEFPEHGAKASDCALLDGAERVAPVFIPGAPGSTAPLLISRLRPAHWKGEQSLDPGPEGPTGVPGPPGVAPRTPWASGGLEPPGAAGHAQP
jgi:hypothetical protein